MVDPTVPNRVRSTFTLFVRNVFVKPIREGRLREVDWPIGLKPIVIVSLAAYVLGVVLVLFAGVIRAVLPLYSQIIDDVPAPRAVFGLLLALSALALALAATGALHASPWLRWTMTAFVSALLIYTASSGDFSLDLPIARTVGIVCALGLILVVALRGHRRFAWFEFVAVAALVFTPMVVSISLLSDSVAWSDFDVTPILVTSVLGSMAGLAVPAAIASGAAVAELAVSSAVWVAAAFRDGLNRAAVIVLLMVLIAWRIADAVPQVVTLLGDFQYEVVPLLGGVSFLAVVSLGWLALRRIRLDRPHPTVGGLVGALSRSSLAIAAILTSIVPYTFLMLILSMLLALRAPDFVVAAVQFPAFALSSLQTTGIVQVGTGIGLIVLSAVLARKGRESAPELLSVLGITTLVLGVTLIAGLALPWSSESLSLIATVACLALLAWVLLTGRATTGRLTSISIALLAAALFAHPQWLSDPLGSILGSAAVAALLVGFTWNLLTGYGVANDDSPRYPRPARVLLLLSNTVLATTILAYVALSHSTGASFDLAGFAEVGQTVFGTSLIACTLCVATMDVIRGRDDW